MCYKRIISLLLALTLLAGTIPPIPVRAADTLEETVTSVKEETTAATEVSENEGTGTEEPVVEIPEAIEESVPESTGETIPAAEDQSAENVAEAAGAVIKSGTLDGGFAWTMTDDGTLTISGSGTVTVSDWYDITGDAWSGNGVVHLILEEGITAVGGSEFTDISTLTTVTMPAGLVSVGGGAFANCTALKTIHQVDGLTSIGSFAFQNCSSLSEILLGEDLTELGRGALCGTAIKHMTFPGTVQTVGGYSNWASLESVTIDPGVQEISANAFYGCKNLKTVFIDYGLTTIGDSAFGQCNNLETVNIPDSVTTFGEKVFEYCSDALKTVILPDSMPVIPKGMFFRCESLESVVLPKDLETISDKAFSGCWSLRSIKFPDSLKTIGEEAFLNCTLETVTITKNVESIAYGAFSTGYTDYPKTFKIVAGNPEYNVLDGVLYCENGQILHTYPQGKEGSTFTVPKGVLVIGTKSFYSCSLERVVLQEGVKSIGDCALNGFVRTVVIPKSLTTIGESAFSSNTTDIYYAGEKKDWEKISIADWNPNLENATIHYGGVIATGTFGDDFKWEFKASGELLISGFGRMEDFVRVEDLPWVNSRDKITSVRIGSGITRIGANSFNGCTELETVTLPRSVTGVGESAFYGCKSLSTVIFQGTEEEYDRIGVMKNNTPLEEALVSYQYLSDYLDNSAIKINGPGSAYAFYRGEPNTTIRYSKDGQELTGTTDQYGVVRIPLGTFEKKGSYPITIQILQVGDLELEVPQEVTPKVTVTDFSFSQSWEFSFDAGADAKVGPGLDAAGVSARLFSVGVSNGLSLGGEASRTHTDGKDSLSLTTKVGVEKGASVSAGITQKNEQSAFTYPSISAGGKIGGSVNYGIEIPEYNKNSVPQHLAIGGFFLEQQLILNPNAVLFKDFYSSIRGKIYNIADIKATDGSGVTAALNAGASAGSLQINGKELFDLGSISGSVTIGFSESGDSTGSSANTTSFKSNVALSSMSSSFGEDVSIKNEGLGANLMTQDIKISTKSSKNKESLEIVSVDGTTAGLRFFMLDKIVKSDWNKYTFSGKSLKDMASNSSAIKGYVNGTNLVIGPFDIANIAEGISYAYEPIPYEKEKRSEVVFSSMPMSIPLFEIGVAAGSLEFAVSAQESTSATTLTGYAAQDILRITSESNRSTPNDSELWELTDIIKNGFNALANAAKEFFKTVVGKIGEAVDAGKAWIGEVGDSVHNWSVELITSVEGWFGRSYQVSVLHTGSSAMALNSGIRSNAVSSDSFSKAATVGSVVLVSVRDDDTGLYLDDFSVQPLKLTIRYAEEELEAAGLSIYSPVVQNGDIAMYRYSDDGDYFEYIGGVNDLDAMTVTAEITKPGQYVLAVDSCAPSLESLDISDFRSTPTITAQVDDLSGLDMDSFVFTLDGTVKVDSRNIADHYDPKTGLFTYDVTEALAEGEHTMSFTLADTTGNSETYEYSFNVDLTAPVIGEVTVTGSTNAGSAVEVRAQVSDANLTDVYAVFSKRLPDGTWSDEVGTLMGNMGDGLWGLDYEGDGSSVKIRVVAMDIGENTAESEILEAHPFVEAITVPQDYILLNVDETAQLNAEAYPEELSEGISWTVEAGGEDVVSVENGTVTALGEGTAYVIASVSDGEVTLTDRCRIDVAAPIELNGIQLSTNKLTAELYSTNYAEFDILLKLPQNFAATAAATAATPENKGVAITSAKFTDPELADLFDLVTLDDRTVAVVPNEKAVWNPDLVGKSYSSAVTVTVQGKEYTSEALTLTVKKTLPKLKATVPAFNNFWSGQTQEITITGATVTGISCENLPDWLELNGTELSLNENVPEKGGSAKLPLLVETEEWAVPVETTLAVKCSYKAPGLKLSASSVQLAGVNSDGVKLQLLSKDKKLTQGDLGVNGISVPDGYSISNYNTEDGTFIIKAESGFQPGKISLEVGFSNTSETVAIPLTVKVTPVTLKPAPNSITLNSDTGDSAAVTVTATPADYRLTAPKLRLIGADKSDKLNSGELKLSYENGRLSISTTDLTPDNAKYTLYVSAEGGKEAALKISTTNAEPTLKLKANGNLDLSFPDRKIGLTTTFKNHSGGNLKAIDYTVTEFSGKTILDEDSKAIQLTKDGADLFVQLKESAGINVKNTYTLNLKLTLENGKELESSVKIPVKQTNISLKLSANKLTLNKAIGDKATVTVTCATKDYNFTEPVWQLLDSKGREVEDGILDISWADGKLTVATTEATPYGASYKLQVSPEEGAKAVTLAIVIPSEAKSKVTGTLKATGNLDVIRDGTALTITPTWKNCNDAEREEILTIRNGSGEDVTAQFVIEEENGKYILTRAGALDHTQKYTATLTATFANGEIAVATGALKLKMGSAKLTVNADSTTLFANDKHSRVNISFVSADTTLNKVARVELDPKLANQFELFDYGNGQYAIGFKDGNIPAKITSVNLALNVWLEGNETAKANASVKVKVSIIR